MRALVIVIRIALAALWAAAGILKVRDPSGFAQEVANFQLFPAAASFVAATLPMTEIVIALGLFCPWRHWRQAAALASTAVMAVFLVAVVSVVVRGVNTDCGCFGNNSGPVSWLTVARNLGLLGASLFLVRSDRPR